MEPANILDALALTVDAALLRRAAFEAVIVAPGLAIAALAVPFLAGASEMAGQAFVFANRGVTGWRAAASFALTGLVYLTSVALWTFTAHFLLGIEGVRQVTDLQLLGVVSLGYSPRLLSVLTVAPYYGELLGRALDAWSMACVGWGVCVITAGPIPLVVGCAVMGWLGSLLVRRFAGWLVAPILLRLGLVTEGMIHA